MPFWLLIWYPKAWFSYENPALLPFTRYYACHFTKKNWIESILLYLMNSVRIVFLILAKQGNSQISPTFVSIKTIIIAYDLSLNYMLCIVSQIWLVSCLVVLIETAGKKVKLRQSMTNLIEHDTRWSCFEANSAVADCHWRQMIITQQPLWNLSAEAQENKIVCQWKNEMKLVLTTKLSRYKDWYATTNFDAEIINWNDQNFAVPMLFQI